MLGPERYLDERQKMVRDWAQRSAYRVIKWALLLAGVGLFLHGVLPGSSSPYGTIDPYANVYIPVFASSPSTLSMTYARQVLMPVSMNWPTDPLHVLLYYGTLLACVVLLVTILPITIVVWKKDPSRAAAGLK
ncbi:hypothetical protein KSZ_73180 [Dictyobacter formicarum]|uniref:Cytochrome b/b6 C-terminal region profile domain-containing protein n=2 Tax=Dictyobacter formicarum TaxID=2778368 RepID=A0ABQ3VSQ5_9CHLR|nr:hypothetical protein KSZ_73180 [Dictyobacter formicarum]